MSEKKFHYLIIGGGMTADSVIRGIREIDKENTIGLISRETNPPYNRPPLSKGLWKKMKVDQIWRNTAEMNVDLFLNQDAMTLDLLNKQVITQKKDHYTFDKLMLATGCKPVKLTFSHPRIIYFRTLQDYLSLRELTEKHNRFAVIGGGFIGSELAAALNSNGKEVIMIFPESGISARIFPGSLSQAMNAYYQQKGITILSGQMVKQLTPHEDKVTIEMDTGTIEVDAVVAGLGVHPNTTLASEAGLEVNNGIVVDRAMRTTNPDVFSAGDVANFYNPSLDLRLRVEHEENANKGGAIAGRTMAGEISQYDFLPSFYSDLFDFGFEAIGMTDSRLQIYEDWQEPYQKGVIYYLENDRIRGILLANLWGKLDEAREVIEEHLPNGNPERLRGRIK